MPELIEVELYRAALDAAVGRPIAAVELRDPTYLRPPHHPVELDAALVGSVIESTGRRGKLATAALDSGRTLGLRFGMTGRLVVDDVAPIDRLEYASGRDDEAWDRFVLRLADGGVVRINDPRRFGSVALDPDLTALGPDATAITARELAVALASDRSLKSVLLDQSRIAGLGNLLVDETLWRAGLSPIRTARMLGETEIGELRRSIRRTVRVLTARGGSHTGDLPIDLRSGGHCPRDGAVLRRETVAGRTTLWCPEHQH